MSSAAGTRPPGTKSDDQVIVEIERRFAGFPAPEHDFDAVREDPKALAQFGVPPRPDPKAQPEQYRVWELGFGRPIRFAAFQVDPNLLRAVKFRPAAHRIGQTFAGSSRVGNSQNWSGASITANNNKRFVQVWGTWRIPQNLKLPPGAGPQPPGAPQYACSNWIGLDGQGLYFDSALPQIGTVAILQPNGDTVAQAWTQWWARGDQNTIPLPIGSPAHPFDIYPGDEIICIITVINRHHIHFAIGNLSANPPQFRFIKATAPVVNLPHGLTAMPNISGTTAEWIMERPGIVYTNELENFPDYGETKFGLCVAVEGDHESISALAEGRLQDLRRATLIRMFEVRKHPARTALISIPYRVSDTSIQLRYGDFRN